MERDSRNRRQADVYATEITAMAAALASAGVELPTFMPRHADGTSVASIDFSERSTAEQLTALVLVAGRRNLRVPLELALRVLGRDGSQSVVEIVKKFDIIRWSDDENGEQYLGCRNALEAEILSRSDFGDKRSEVVALASLLKSVRPRSGVGGPEVEFAVDLLYRVGPETRDGEQYVPWYLEIVNALRELRAVPGRSHPRLSLYEANFARQWTMWAQRNEEATPAKRIEVLSGAASLLDETLVGLKHPKTRLNLLVESASVIGALAYEESKGGADQGRLQELAAQVVQRTSEARAIDPGSYYPIDVIAWVVLRLVQGDFVDETQRVQLTADALASLISIDSSDLSAYQKAKYDDRLAQLASLQNDDALANAHLKQLEENNDPAAYFLRALRVSGLLTKTFSADGASQALKILRSAPTEVRSDWRCSRLLLDLYWMNKTGNRLMQGEREALPFGIDDWDECLSVVDEVVGLAEFDRYRVDFLRGLALFHVGQFQQMRHVFEKLDQETVTLSRRIVATYVVSNSDGTPRTFTGQVRSIRPDGSRGSVWVEQLSVELPFIPRRFSSEQMDRNDALPEFEVAFNMRGPFADPIRSRHKTVR